MGVIMLIMRVSDENLTWGAPRMKDELALLGHEVAVSTVAKYMVRRGKPTLDQSWKTFLHNFLGPVSWTRRSRRRWSRATCSIGCERLDGRRPRGFDRATVSAPP